MDKIVIGEIAKAHGIKGALKIIPLTDDIKRFKDLTAVYIQGEQNKRVVKSCVIGGGSILLFLEGINTRNDAEIFKGKQISVEYGDAVDLKKGQYFIKDIIGCAMLDQSGQALGKVTDVLSHGAADIFVVSGEKNFMVPFLKDLVSEIDVVQKRITVINKRFDEVVCYED
jgi:16S rRNA processing protein RimM